MYLKEKIKKTLASVSYIYYKYNTKTPKVLSVDDTLDVLLNTNKSLVRFGDGEILHINGRGTGFQSSGLEIANELQGILVSEQENLLVAIPEIFEGLDIYIPATQSFWKDHLFFFGKTYLKCCKRDVYYGNAFVSRCYMIWKNKEVCENYFNKFKMVFRDKDILVVEGVNTHNGVGNDLFSQAKSIARIIGPGKNAYAVQEQIFEECCKFPKETLILFSLGIAAKGLVNRLFQKGYRVLDIGNLDMEYEWFLMQATEKKKIEKHSVVGIEENQKAGYNKYLEEVVCWITQK